MCGTVQQLASQLPISLNALHAILDRGQLPYAKGLQNLALHLQGQRCITKVVGRLKAICE